MGKHELSYHPSRNLAEVENEWIEKSLEYHNGNIVLCAKSLNISRQTLYRKIEVMGGNKWRKEKQTKAAQK